MKNKNILKGTLFAATTLTLMGTIAVTAANPTSAAASVVLLGVAATTNQQNNNGKLHTDNSITAVQKQKHKKAVQTKDQAPLNQFNQQVWVQHFLDELNRLRAQNGLQPVTLDPDLTTFTQGRADTINANQKLDHTGAYPTLGKPGWSAENIERIDYTGGRNTDAKNAIAWFYDDGGVPTFGHRKTMLAPFVDKVGIGISYNPTTKELWVAMTFHSDKDWHNDEVAKYEDYITSEGIDNVKHPTKYDMAGKEYWAVYDENGVSFQGISDAKFNANTKTPSNPNGTEDGFPDKPITEKGTVEAHYVDENGNDILAPISQSGDVDSNYETTAQTLPGYTLVKTPANAKGKFAKGTTKVVYEYKKNAETQLGGAIHVQYVDENGQPVADEGTLTGGNVGDSYTVTAPKVNGYHVVSANSKTGKYTKDEQTVKFVYAKDEVKPVPVDKGTVTVNYVDENGNSVAPSESIKGNVGEAYYTYAKSVDGYTLTGIPANAAGKYTKDNTTVTYKYKKNAVTPPAPVEKGTVTVNYVDENGQPITASDNLSGNVGDNYSTSAKTIDGYTLIETPANASGKYTKGNTTVTYKYKKNAVTPPAPVEKGTATISYVDENGTPIAPADSMSGNIGDSYSTSAKTIDGYTLIETPANASGQYVKGNTNVVYKYKKNAVTPPTPPEPEVETGTVTVSYVDENGAPIAPAASISGKVGSNYATSPKAIDGYTLTSTPTNAAGQYIKGNTSVVYQYKKNSTNPVNPDKPVTPDKPVIPPKPVAKGTVNVHFVDENGQDIASPVTTTGNVGTAYNTSAQNIYGYVLTGNATNANGVYTDGTTNVVYHYVHQNGGTIHINLVDTNGKVLMPAHTLTGGKVGDYFKADSPVINGYHLVSAGILEGHYTPNEQTLQFVYEADVAHNANNSMPNGQQELNSVQASEKLNNHVNANRHQFKTTANSNNNMDNQVMQQDLKTLNNDKAPEKQTLPKTGKNQMEANVLTAIGAGLIALMTAVTSFKKNWK